MNSISRREQDKITEVFTKVLVERNRQLELLEQRVITVDLFDSTTLPTTKLVFPVEELGEVARAIRNMQFQEEDSHRYDPTTANLQTELVQLATHVITWRASLSV